MFTMKFYTPKERPPHDGDTVVWMRKDRFYGSWDLQVAEVGFVWVVYSKDKPTGESIGYTPGEETPEGAVLHFMLDDLGYFDLDDDGILMAYSDDIQQELDATTKTR